MVRAFCYVKHIISFADVGVGVPDDPFHFKNLFTLLAQKLCHITQSKAKS